MGLAQLEAWTAVHCGTVDAAEHAINATLADAALGQMILHRQRSTAAKVMRQFFVRAGDRFASLQVQALWGTANLKSDEATTKTVERLADLVAGDSTAILFERAQNAELTGQWTTALADLERVRERYPGFAVAAIASARAALALNKPDQAVHALAGVEHELTHMRDGAALLADSLRQLGLHEAASRYDLAALTNFTHILANVCAPVDVTEEIVGDRRMRPAHLLGAHADGRSLYNDRGVYYSVSPLFEEACFALHGSGHAGSAGRLSKPTLLWNRLLARMQFFLMSRAPRRVVGDKSRTTVRVGLRLGTGTLSRKRLAQMQNFLLSRYKRLPVQVRYAINLNASPFKKFALSRTIKTARILEGDHRSAFYQSRLEAGLKRIFREAHCSMQTQIVGADRTAQRLEQTNVISLKFSGSVAADAPRRSAR